MFMLYFVNINGKAFRTFAAAATYAIRAAEKLGYSEPEILSEGGGNWEIEFFNREGYTLRAEIELC